MANPDATTMSAASSSGGGGSSVGSGSGPLQMVAYCVMAGIIAVGSIGNCIVLYVYARKKDGHAANIFIISLAVSDLIACALVIPMTIAMEANNYESNVFVCKLYYLLNCSGIPFSSMLMTAIAVERYFCICRPFLRAITVPRAKAIVLSLGAMAFTLGLTIAAFCSAVVRKFSDGANGTALEYASYGECREISDIKRNFNDSAITATLISISDASLVFYNIFQKLHLSLFGICILLVFALYVKIYDSVLRLRRKRRERRKNRMQLVPTNQHQQQQQQQHLAVPDAGDVGCAADIGVGDVDASNGDLAQAAAAAEAAAAVPQQHQQRRKSLRLVKDSDALQNLKTAAMLFVVTIVFTTTFIPAALMTLKVIGFNILIFYLYYLTHATNPLIYCFMNRNFRDDLRRIFCKMDGERRRQQQQRQQQQQQQHLLSEHQVTTARAHRLSTVAVA